MTKIQSLALAAIEQLNARATKCRLSAEDENSMADLGWSDLRHHTYWTMEATKAEYRALAIRERFFKGLEADEVQGLHLMTVLQLDGWSPHQTGGGCMAYYFEVNPETGEHFILTDNGGCDLPEDFGSNALLGHFDSAGSTGGEPMELSPIESLEKLKNCMAYMLKQSKGEPHV